MQPIEIEEVTQPVIIRFHGEQVQLESRIQKKIDAYWNELISSGRSYKRGEVFTVTDVRRTGASFEVLVQKTDYAHYLYSQNVDPVSEYSVRIIHTAGPIITSDNHIVFGQMGPQTAQAGKYQLCGGGLDDSDLGPDGILNPEHNIIQEFLEEFGVDVTDTGRVKSFAQKYLKTGGPTGKMTIIYVVELTEMKDEFLANYAQYEAELKEQGELPEFGRIVTFSLDDPKPLNDFLQNKENKMDEYLRPFLEYILEK